VTVRPQSPGERLALELEARHWLQKDLAEIINRPMQMVSEIISGRKEITRETAAQLGAALGTPPEFWLGMQDTYQLWELSRHGPTQRKLAEIRQRARTAVPSRHNHRTRDVKPPGQCPACDAAR
jgi:HTH-type transcriptional regulator/antitoxin HigA